MTKPEEDELRFQILHPKEIHQNREEMKFKRNRSKNLSKLFEKDKEIKMKRDKLFGNHQAQFKFSTEVYH